MITLIMITCVAHFSLIFLLLMLIGSITFLLFYLIVYVLALFVLVNLKCCLLSFVSHLKRNLESV